MGSLALAIGDGGARFRCFASLPRPALFQQNPAAVKRQSPSPPSLFDAYSLLILLVTPKTPALALAFAPPIGDIYLACDLHRPISTASLSGLSPSRSRCQPIYIPHRSPSRRGVRPTKPFFADPAFIPAPSTRQVPSGAPRGRHFYRRVSRRQRPVCIRGLRCQRCFMCP